MHHATATDDDEDRLPHRFMTSDCGGLFNETTGDYVGNANVFVRMLASGTLIF